MNNSDLVHYNGQDLPESGPCPRCGHPGASYKQIDPSTEEHKITCSACGKYIVSIDELEDYLDTLRTNPPATT